MQVQVDEDTVGVGDFVHLELMVQSADGEPSEPQLGATPGFVIRGQSGSPSQTHIIVNGAPFIGTVDAMGSPAEAGGDVYGWAHQDQRERSCHLTKGVTLHVVPAGQAPRHPPPPQQQSPFGFSPFDPWKGLIQGLDKGQDLRSAPALTDPKLSLDAPRGDYYFLHATVDKTNVVVGEQVVFSVYEYIDQGRSSVEVDEDASIRLSLTS